MRMGLVGDHQRLASEWRYADTFSDRGQARAAAGLDLLLAYEQAAYRSMDNQATLAAREEGLRILGSAFGGASRQAIDPHRNAGLEGSAPAFGETAMRSETVGCAIRSRRPMVFTEISTSTGRSPTTATIQPRWIAHMIVGGAGWVGTFSSETGGGLSSDKRDMYAARIEQRAVLPRPWAQAVAQEPGRPRHSGQPGPGHGHDGLAGALERFTGSIFSNGDISDAVEAGGDGWTDARGAIIDTRMD